MNNKGKSNKDPAFAGPLPYFYSKIEHVEKRGFNCSAQFSEQPLSFFHNRKMLVTISTELNRKQTQQDALVTLLEYSEYRKGARNDPARAPHDTPINCAIKVTALLY